MKRIVLRLVLVAVSLVAALALAEWIVRLTDPWGASYYRDFGRYRAESWLPIEGDPARWPASRIYQHRPGLALEFESFAMFTDELGLRVGEPGLGAPADDAGALRVLCIGDSTTFCWGVDDGESWPRQLERRGRAADGRALQVLNAGCLVYDSVQEADLLRHLGPLLEPELVLLMFNYNDLVPTYEDLLKEVEVAVDHAEPGLAGQLRYRLARWLPGLHGLLEYSQHAESSARVERHDLPSLEELTGYPESWPRSRDALEDMRTRCAELGAGFVVLDHSDPRVPDVEAWCAERGVPYVDVAWTDAEWFQDVRNSAADAHANARGNRIVTDKVLGALAELGLLAPAGG